MSRDDLSLFHLFKAGDISAFEKLFNTHYMVLCAYANKIIGNMDESRDIVQDVFVTIYENRAGLEISSSFKSYLFRAVHNASLNYLKQAKTHRYHHENIKQYLPFSESSDVIIEAELEEKILRDIRNLPGQCRKIFEMNRFEGKKNKEIAEILGLSVRTVETQISKALKILRKNLTNFWVLF